MSEMKRKLSYNRFLTIPFLSGSIAASSIGLLDESVPEYMHSHVEHELYYCLDGCMHLRLEDSVLTLEKNEFVFLKPGTVHGVADEPHLKKEYFICIFQPVRTQGKDVPTQEKAFFTHFEQLFARAAVVRGADTRGGERLVREMAALCAERPFAWELQLRGLLLELLILLARNFPVLPELLTEESAESENVAVTIERFIHDNFSRDISLQDAARAVHMTPRNVNRVLQKYYGKSFQKCLMLIRLGSVKKYLIETECSMEKIAELVGLSPQTLFRSFRREEGLAPTEYRKLHGGRNFTNCARKGAKSRF